jgi:hypothetical protein
VITTSAASTASRAELLRERGGQVDADLGHRRTDGRVDLGGGRGTRGADLYQPLGVVVEQSGGHLRSARVVHTDEEDLWDVGHGGSL